MVVDTKAVKSRMKRTRAFFDIHVDPPKSPQLELIRMFHRNEHSFVSFLRRESTDAEMKTLMQISVGNLATRGPSRAQLRTDAYFSINGFRRWGTRRTEDLSALNAAFVDLDYHSQPAPLMWQEVAEVIESAISAEIIPAPSVLVNSGQGAWLIWLLVADNDSARAPTAPLSNRQFLRAINEKLAANLSAFFPKLGVDAQSAELSRCLRIPGSLNSKSATPVRFFVHRTPWDAPLTYTLDRLAAEIDVHPPSFRRKQQSLLVTRLPKTSGAKTRGGAANLSRVLKARLDEIARIEQSRGGFREGHRNIAALVIAVTLRGLHRSPDQILDEVSAFARGCRPPLSPANIRGAVAERRYRFTNTNIAARLGVTLEEADSLGLRHIRPDYRPKRPDANTTKGRKDAAAARRQALRTIIEARENDGLRNLPPLRELVTLLSERNVAASVRTVSKDLDAMRIARNRRRGRPSADAHQLLLQSR